MLTIEVSDVISATKKEVFSLLDTPQKYITFEKEMRLIKLDGDKVHAEVRFLGLRKRGVFKYLVTGDSAIILELIDGDVGMTKSWHKLFALSGNRTRVIHGVQLDLNSRFGNLLSGFLVRKIKSHERTELKNLKKFYEIKTARGDHDKNQTGL